VDSDLLIPTAAVAASAGWVVAAAMVLWSRMPPQPHVGALTLELGAEPPAVANFLTHGFRVTDDAVPATLIDLAARNVVDIEQRGPGVFYVRLRTTSDEALTSYERRVLDHLRSVARDGVVPGDALTTGPQHESARWMRGFVSGVVSDAQALGLSRDAVGGAVLTVLTGLAVVPAALIWTVWEFEAGSWWSSAPSRSLAGSGGGTRSARLPRAWTLHRAGSVYVPSLPRTRFSRPTRRSRWSSGTGSLPTVLR
jgi:Predicted membrane protein (DUF2207)